MELDGRYIFDFEIENGLRYVDDGLFHHVEPSWLCLDVSLDAGLSWSRFKVVSRLNQIDACSRMDEINKHLILRSVILSLHLFQVWVIFQSLGTYFGLDIDLNIFFNLYDYISESIKKLLIDGRSLINGFIFVQLQNYWYLRFICHRQNKSFRDVAIFYVVVECHAVKPYVLLIKVNCVFASGNWQVHIKECSNRLTCKFAYFGFLDNLLVDQFCNAWLLFPFILFLHLIILFLLLLFSFLNVETYFAKAVVISDLLLSSLNYDVWFVNCWVIDFVEVDGQNLAGPIYRHKFQRRIVLEDLAIVHSFVRHVNER